MTFVTDGGRAIKLGSLLGKGGEASVYIVEGSRDVVAKIYHSPPSNEKQEKIQWMTRLAAPDISQFAAWPVATLKRRGQNAVVGVLMPKVDGAREIHELYGPAHRRTEFPNADWQFLIRAARNCAAAFATLHQKSVVIGDVNQGNLLVTRKAIIKMIDCDSFQLTSSGRLFRCTVGVAHFQPPELQTARFDQVVRTPNHDNFGLAVIIFHLLFMGRHPFSVRPLDREDVPIEAAIKASRFPYGQQAARYRVAPPPHSLQLSNVGRQLAGYFESAFSSSSANGGRPTAQQWATALASFESNLTKCSHDAGHVYFGAVNACPWCAFERNGGPDFFVSVSVARTSTAFQTFDLDRTWLHITSVQGPQGRFRAAIRISAGSVPASVLPSRLRKELQFQKLLKNVAMAGAIASVLGMFYGPILILTIPVAILFGVFYMVVSHGSNIGAVRRKKLDAAKGMRATVVKLADALRSNATRGRSAFEAKLSELEQAYLQYKSLADRYAKAKMSLSGNAANRQLDEWLDRQYISQANLSGIGPGRVATLQSYGIETAKDVSRGSVVQIPGFGPKLTSTLVGWRRVCEARFTFDPHKGIPAADIQRLERTFSIERAGLIRTLENGATALEHIAASTASVVSSLDAELAKAEYKLEIANAELSSLS